MMFGFSETDDIWNKMMVFAREDDWKLSRRMFSPQFTSAKLKTTLKIMRKGTADLVELLTRYSASGEYVNTKEVCGKLSMDVIAASSLGIDVGSFK